MKKQVQKIVTLARHRMNESWANNLGHLPTVLLKGHRSLGPMGILRGTTAGTSAWVTLTFIWIRRALRYFERHWRLALTRTPWEADRLVQKAFLPQFSQCFRGGQWTGETLAEMEAQLRQMDDDDKDHTRGADVAQMEDTLNLVFDEISFEMGFNGESMTILAGDESSCLSWSTSEARPKVLGTGNIWWAASPAKHRPGPTAGYLREDVRNRLENRAKTASPSPTKSCCPCSGGRPGLVVSPPHRPGGRDPHMRP